MRSQRRVVAAHPHHVTLQGAAARALFSYPADYLRFLRYLAEAVARNACQLHAFALLRDRADLLISPRTAADLSNCIQVACQRYALVRNRLAKRRGAVFMARFGAQPLMPASLDSARVAIEQGPVIAGRCVSPGAYRWSSANVALAAAIGVVARR